MHRCVPLKQPAPHDSHTLTHTHTHTYTHTHTGVYLDNNPLRTIPWEFELFKDLERISGRTSHKSPTHSKEPYTHSKETYIHTKEPCILSESCL